jgi:hypothetical protein
MARVHMGGSGNQPGHGGLVDTAHRGQPIRYGLLSIQCRHAEGPLPRTREGPCSHSSHSTCRSLSLSDYQELQASLSTLKDTVSAFPKTIQVGIVYSYAKAAQYFLDNTENRRTCWALGATMTAVCAAWLVPRWGPGMMRRFTHDPLSGKSYTLLTSTFRSVIPAPLPRVRAHVSVSHKSIIHLGFNCMALASFGTQLTGYALSLFAEAR